MRSRFVHPVAAFAMSGFWFIVLFPFVGRSEGFGARDLPVNLIATCLAGLTVAMIFRRSIVAAEGARFHLLAIVLPGVAAFAFGCFVGLFQWLGPAFRPGGKTSPGILLVPIYCVVFGHLALFFVTLPMGYFSQWAMRRVGSAAVVDSAGGGPLSSRSAGDGPSNRGGA